MDYPEIKAIRGIVRSTRLNEETLSRFADEYEEAMKLSTSDTVRSEALRARAETLRQRAGQLSEWAAGLEAWLGDVDKGSNS